MRIQIIGSNEAIKSNEYDILYSPFSRPITFDLFDINIIDMQDENLWKNDREDDHEINRSNDLESLQKLIENAKKSKIIILFPLNYLFEYYLSCRGGYYNKYYLKDNIGNLKIIMGDLIPEIENYDFIYENSITKCGNSVFTSAFCFSFINEYALTKAEGSGKATTMPITDKCILTTLKLCEKDCILKDFLMAIGVQAENKIDIPDWLNTVNILDDKAQQEIIEKNSHEIVELQEGIKKAEEKLNKNLYYKSILSETGDNLVEVVFDMLGQMLDYDLSEFVDKKKEDFRIKFEDVTFIGEIKGINTNVKSGNISQVENHCRNYEDMILGTEENIKGLLVINTLRDKKLEEREDVHIDSVKLAKKYGVLIITTVKLLALFEKFIFKQVTSLDIIEAFKKQIGLLDIDKI